MPTLSNQEIITQQMIRAFVQWGGALPQNPLRYSGQGANRTMVEGVSIPDAQGAINPIWMPDLYKTRSYELAGTTVDAPELPTATVIFTEALGQIPRHLLDMGCFSVYSVSGRCANLANPYEGWDDFVTIYENGRVSGPKDLGSRGMFDSDEMVQASVPVTFENIYPVGALYFSEQEPAQISREVMDVVYANALSCSGCDADAPTQRMYRVSRSSGSGSPGLPAEVGYTTNGGATWVELAITGIGASEDPVAMDIVGTKLVIVTKTAGSATVGGYYWATINESTGVPGSFTKVTAGFVANKAPNDIYVANSREVYFAADGGYIYKSTDITVGVSVADAGEATTNNLLRIDGSRNTVVAVGDASTLVYSDNGNVFSAPTVAFSGVSLSGTAVSVKSSNEWWVGTSNSGRVFYTTNRGESWAESVFSGSGSGDVKDIVWASQSVGYIAHNTTAPAGRVFATFTGGETWSNLAKRINAVPVTDYIRRMAVPTQADIGRACNNLLCGGLAGDGTDGVTLLAQAAVF